MCDVLFTLALYDIILRNKRNRTTLFILGGVAMFISNISVIPLFLIGLYLLFEDGVKNKKPKHLMLLVGWTTLMAINYFKFIHNHPSKKIMLEYWNERFLPSPLQAREFFEFILYATGTTFKKIVNVDVFWILALLSSLWGLWHLIKNGRYASAFLLAAPPLVHLVLSSLKLYPYAGRFILYLVPLMIILVSIGWTHISKSLRPKWIYWSFLLLPFVYFYFAVWNTIPIEREEIKRSLQFIQENRTDDSPIYVYYGGQRAYRFYTQYGPYGNMSQAIRGKNGRKNANKLKSDINQMQGKVWLLFAHVHIADHPVNDEEAFMLDHIKSRSGKIMRQKKVKGSSAYLVDLGFKKM